jgi:Anti-sigma factor NepR
MGGRGNMKAGKTADVQPPVPDADAEARDAMGRPVSHRKTEVRLGREVQAQIGQQLRAMYDSVVKEGVPQHINDLVRRLSEQDDGAA